MKTLCLIPFVYFIHFYSFAQSINYSTLTIPDSLKKNADIVIRSENIKLQIKDKNTARYEVHRVVTLMNEQGSSLLSFVQFSDKFHLLEDAEINVYDQLGNKKNSYSKKQMASLNYGEGLVPEGKVTYLNLSAPSYPVSLEINYSIKFNGIFSLPGYDMQSPWQSVQSSTFEIEVPANLGVRYKLLNTLSQPNILHNGNKDTYTWEQKNLKAYILEKHSGSPYSYEPTVLIAPNKFQLDNYDGDMTSWKNFGSWIDNLYSKTTELSPERIAFYQDMVKNAKSNKQKAAILYSYMQNNMRYVSIQLGIGGLRPFPASFVDSKKYGDCKALSNYLKSALDAVGIKSNLVIIQGSELPRKVWEDFPANYFNHCILCIPENNDTTWLECTSTTLPFAQLGPFTENRKAMLITNSGGVLVNTPVSKYTENTMTVKTNIEVNDEGGGKAISDFTLVGDDRDELLMRYHELKEDEKRKFFVTNLNWKLPDILEVTNSKDKANPYLVTAKMEYEKLYSFKAGNKLFFSPRLYPIFEDEIIAQSNRQRDYYFSFPYQVIDTTVYHFNAGFTMENMPKNKSADFSFAKYNVSYNWDESGHTLSVIALLQIKDRVIKASNYSKLVEFNMQVTTDMNEKIIFNQQ